MEPLTIWLIVAGLSAIGGTIFLNAAHSASQRVERRKNAYTAGDFTEADAFTLAKEIETRSEINKSEPPKDYEDEPSSFSVGWSQQNKYSRVGGGVLFGASEPASGGTLTYAAIKEYVEQRKTISRDSLLDYLRSRRINEELKTWNPGGLSGNLQGEKDIEYDVVFLKELLKSNELSSNANDYQLFVEPQTNVIKVRSVEPSGPSKKSSQAEKK